MNTALLITSLLSAACFASVFTLPEVDPHSAPKNFAAGMNVLERVLGQLFFAAMATMLWLVQIRRQGVRRTFQQPAGWVSFLLLLPAVGTLGVGLLFLATRS